MLEDWCVYCNGSKLTIQKELYIFAAQEVSEGDGDKLHWRADNENKMVTLKP